jgi:DNA-binding NarL/FixJ family response regulator
MALAGVATVLVDAPTLIGMIDDDPAVLRFFASVIGRDRSLAITFAASTLVEAREALATVQPALCLVDLGLPDGSGVDLVREIKAVGETRVLVTTVLGDRATVMTALKAGADGYILKTTRAADMLGHIRQTLDGFTPISPQVASFLLEVLRPEAATRAVTEDGESLTDREVEILGIFSRGLTYDETARVLGISPNTVRDFVKKIYGKLKVHSRSEALFEALSLGLLDREPGSGRI